MELTIHKKIIFTFLFIIFIVGLCACNHKVAMKSVNSQTLVYGNYEYGNYYLSFADPITLKVNQKVKITKGWTDNINVDQNNRIWIPIVSRDGTVPPDNRIILVDINQKMKKEMKVGYAPHYLYFKEKNVYIVCDEDGFSPTLYRIDKNMNVTKVATVHEAGLINGAAFDGENIYLLTSNMSLKNNESYPMIEKLSLNGMVKTKVITKENIGNNALGVVGNKIIVGLQSGNHATLGVFEKQTLQRMKDLPYQQDMVGQILPLKNNIIAVTNYSKIAQSGNYITFVDTIQNKIIKEIQTQNHNESLSIIGDNVFVSTDNFRNTAEIFDGNGKQIKYFKIPTQVFNIEKITK